MNNGTRGTGKPVFGVGRALMLVLMVFLTIASLGGIVGLADRTLVKWWLPGIVCLLIASVAAPLTAGLWGRLTGSNLRLLNMGVALLFTLVFTSGIFYSCNYIFASSQGHEEKMEIVRKYTKTRYQSKRVGRNRYVRGAPYKVYFADIVFPDGRKKSLEIPFKSYKKCREGSEGKIMISRGFFGADVITGNPVCTSPSVEEDEIVGNPWSRYGKRKGKRCRFFGTSGKHYPDSTR